ncbi:MAG: hypothetical protein KGZ58_12405 [Ignavibacteriales bacterium]|nr:hypothetical protein [Ignavibacteriales bacterium]
MPKKKSQYKQISLSKIKTISIANRKSKVQPSDFAKVFDVKENSFSKFTESLPHILVANDLRTLIDDIISSRKKKLPVIVMLGAHVIKVGLSPIIIDLVERNIITAIAMNSAAAIHDSETALFGNTSEDVAVNLLDGTFGMSKETGEFINKTLKKYSDETNYGYGEALATELVERKAKHLSYSILATCLKKNISVTVHAAIGTDIIHQQPTMDGAATGEMSFRDFKIFANAVKDLNGGGVVLNVGSAVILPEVFLKALTVARNLGFKAKGFTTAVFDMNLHYRPTQNVMLRPTQGNGKGFYFVGHHEIMIPLLAAMIKLKVNRY